MKGRRRRVRFATRASIVRLVIFFVVLGVLLCGGCVMFTSMPGETHSGPLPPMTDIERALAGRLRARVEHLAGTIGERNTRLPQNLAAAADWIERELTALGYAPQRQTFKADNVECSNIEVEIPGGERADEIVIVGGHYDSVTLCPGANDNATGTAATLELARLFAGRSFARTVRLVAFVNEEPPYFQTDWMGSVVYARRCRERGEKIVAMFSLETIGCYHDDENSQNYPFPFGLVYPSTGNFIAFVGNVGSRALVRKAVALFREHARFPSEGGAIPSWVPGVGWSDHWSFWQSGYPALMVTDTAPFRYEHYHSAQDRPAHVDFDRMARVVAGIEKVVAGFAEGR